MDFVYIITNTWVNDDGWAISAPQIVIAFDNEKSAKDYVTANQKRYHYTNSRHDLSIVKVPFNKDH